MTTGAELAADFSRYNPRDVEETQRLMELYRDYLLEEFDRTRDVPDGVPVAMYLITYIIRRDGQIVGFCSADFTRYSIELIYVEPTYRHLGVARLLLTSLKISCPASMQMKAPLSPAGRALAKSMGIEVAERNEREAAEAVSAHKHMTQTINRHCPHKLANRSRPCRRCYRKGAPRMAQITVGTYVVARALVG